MRERGGGTRNREGCVDASYNRGPVVWPEITFQGRLGLVSYTSVKLHFTIFTEGIMRLKKKHDTLMPLQKEDDNASIPHLKLVMTSLFYCTFHLTSFLSDVYRDKLIELLHRKPSPPLTVISRYGVKLRKIKRYFKKKRV